MINRGFSWFLTVNFIAVSTGLTCLSLSSCSEKKSQTQTSPSNLHETADPQVTSSPLPSTPGNAKSLFSLISPKDSGITHTNQLDPNHRHKATYVTGWACGGIIVEDFNDDQKPDLFFLQNADKNKLYLQGDSSLSFREVAELAGVGGGEAFSVGGCAGDIDGDGDIDLFLASYDSPCQLFLNQGNNEDGIPIFKESAALAGLNLTEASMTTSLCDYDRDGDLDLFVLANRFYHPQGYPEGKIYEMVGGKPVIIPELQKYYTAIMRGDKVVINTVGRPCYLFRNEGVVDGVPKFFDVSQHSGIGHFRNFGLGCTWFDQNNDGWLDLYIANDFEYDDRLFINNKDGTFTNAIAAHIPVTSYYSMGCVAADMNGDAREDLITLDMAATTHYKAKIAMGSLTAVQKYTLDHAEPRQAMRNTLLLSTGTPHMLETARTASIASSDWSWTPLTADLDNDGDHDLYITNGMVRNFGNADLGALRGDQKIGRTEWDSYANAPEQRETNLAFENQGNLKFTKKAKLWGIDNTGMSYAAAWADLDLDGNIDLIVSNLNEPPSIYHNQQGSKNNRVLISLKQPDSTNEQAIGARVTIRSGGKQQVRSLQPTNGFLSHNHAIIHFGLGSESVIDSLTIRWPDGKTQTHKNLAANCHHTITRRANLPPSSPPKPRATLFVHNSSLDRTLHVDPDFDDFKLQPLLPNKLSHQGPGHAWGDLNGDGKLDFYLAMGASQADRIYTQQGGRFTWDEGPALRADAAGESIAPLIFDADGDGDNDVFVARGSYEFPARDNIQQDKLYLNDGRGNFSPAPSDTLPIDSTVSGHTTAGDIDADGDLDLLVTGRVIPGAYPLASASRLLRNDSAPGQLKFTDITSSHAPDLVNIGMVTSAIFTDTNGNGTRDIMITTEYGPVVRLFQRDGEFVRDQSDAALNSLHGWWNSITPCDVDQDGDMDYIVGNLGTNTKYHPSQKKPYFIYYGDMDGSGNKRIVEAKSQKNKDRPLPVRGRS